MSKKSAKIAATYFVTIICSLGLIGGVGYYALSAYLSSDGSSNISSINPETDIALKSSNEEYVPEAGYGKTGLFIYEAEKRESAVCFMLTRFVPADNKVVLVPLQSDLCTVLDGKTNTLYEFYRLGGSRDAVRAVEAAAGIHVDHYMTFNKENFIIFSNFMGNVDFRVPYNLVYENPQTGENTAIREGNQTLDSITLRKVLTFPSYKGGEEYRAKVVGEITSLLINAGSKGILRDNLDSVFNDIVNSNVDTNITKYDYEELRPAFRYVLSNTEAPCQLVIPSGAYNENNCYVLDESFVKALPRWLGIE